MTMATCETETAETDLRANRFPIDYDAAQKGDIISAARVQAIIGRSPSSKLYELRVLALVGKIESSLWEIGKQFTVCQRKGAIHILDDESASNYLEDRSASLFRGMQRSQRRLLAVDRENLTDERG